MNEELVVYLELAAAKAKQLAFDCKAGRIWEGDIQRGVADIMDSLTKVLAISGKNR